LLWSDPDRQKAQKPILSLLRAYSGRQIWLFSRS
jgi:hypothetical protein